MDTSLIYNPKSIYLDENININTFFEENYMKQNLFDYDLNLKAKEFLNIFNKISFYIHSLYVERKNFLEFKNYLKFLEHISKYSNSTAKLHESYWKINKIIKDRNISNYSDLDQMLGIAKKNINTNADHIILFFNTSMFSSDRIHSNYNFLQEQIELLEVPLKNDKDINNKLKDIYDDCKNSAHFSKLQRDLEGLEGYLRLRFDMPFLYVQVLKVLNILEENKKISSFLELASQLKLGIQKINLLDKEPSYYFKVSPFYVDNLGLEINRKYNQIMKDIYDNLKSQNNFKKLKDDLFSLKAVIVPVITNEKLLLSFNAIIDEVTNGKANNFKEFLYLLNFYDRDYFDETEEPYLSSQVIQEMDISSLKYKVERKSVSEKNLKKTKELEPSIVYLGDKSLPQVKVGDNNFCLMMDENFYRKMNEDYSNLFIQLANVQIDKLSKRSDVRIKQFYKATDFSKIHRFHIAAYLFRHRYKFELQSLIMAFIRLSKKR